MSSLKIKRAPLEIGQTVRRRGPFEATGIIEKKNKNWCFVTWRSGSGRGNPRILDENELEAVA